MKDIFDKVTQSVKDISQNVVEQTKITVTQGKSELELVQLKNELKKLYAQLGEKEYQRHVAGVDSGAMEMLYDSISFKIKQIADVERNIENIRTQQKSTMEELKRNVKKAWSDGEGETRRPEQNEEGYENMKFCNHCNIGNHPEALYCIACGHKFVTTEENQHPEENEYEEDVEE